MEIIRTAPLAVDFQPTTGKHTLFVVSNCTFTAILLLLLLLPLLFVVIFVVVITTAIISMTAVAGKTSTQEISVFINFIRCKNKVARLLTICYCTCPTSAPVHLQVCYYKWDAVKTEGWRRLQLCNIWAKFFENGSLGSEIERDGQEHKHRHMHAHPHAHCMVIL